MLLPLSKIEAVREHDTVQVFLELTSRDERVVIPLGSQPGTLVIGQERVVETHILDAIVASNAIATMITDSNTLNEKFVYPNLMGWMLPHELI